jgi:hypothetical protein
MEGAIELFPDDFGTETMLVLPSPQDSMEEQEAIAVPKKEFCQIGYFKHVAFLAAAEGSRQLSCVPLEDNMMQSWLPLWIRQTMTIRRHGMKSSQM